MTAGHYHRDDPIYPQWGPGANPSAEGKAHGATTQACAGTIYCGANASRFGACGCHLEVELLE